MARAPGIIALWQCDGSLTLLLDGCDQPLQMGTPAYIAPDVLLAGRLGQPNITGAEPNLRVRRSADIWSLGVSLYKMTLGE